MEKVQTRRFRGTHAQEYHRTALLHSPVEMKTAGELSAALRKHGVFVFYQGDYKSMACSHWEAIIMPQATRYVMLCSRHSLQHTPTTQQVDGLLQKETRSIEGDTPALVFPFYVDDFIRIWQPLDPTRRELQHALTTRKGFRADEGEKGIKQLLLVLAKT